MTVNKVTMNKTDTNKPKDISKPESGDTLLEFPCEFKLKPLGYQSPELVPAIKAIVDQHVPAKDQLNWQERPSSKGKFVCVSVTIQARSKQQLDDIYLAFSASDYIRLSL